MQKANGESQGTYVHKLPCMTLTLNLETGAVEFIPHALTE